MGNRRTTLQRGHRSGMTGVPASGFVVASESFKYAHQSAGAYHPKTFGKTTTQPSTMRTATTANGAMHGSGPIQYTTNVTVLESDDDNNSLNSLVYLERETHT